MKSPMQRGATATPTAELRAQAEAAAGLAERYAAPVRVVVGMAAGQVLAEYPGYAAYEDAKGEFARIYGSKPATFLIRPDDDIAWRGPGVDHPGLEEFLNTMPFAKP